MRFTQDETRELLADSGVALPDRAAPYAEVAPILRGAVATWERDWPQLTGWKPDLTWGLIGAALLASLVADGVFLFQTATDSYQEGTIVDAFWPASMLLLGAAVWQPVPKATPGYLVLAYAAASLEVLAGVALQLRRTASAAAMVLAAFFAIFVLLWARRIVGAPQLFATWSGTAEQLAIALGGLVASICAW